MLTKDLFQSIQSLSHFGNIMCKKDIQNFKRRKYIEMARSLSSIITLSDANHKWPQKYCKAVWEFICHCWSQSVKRVKNFEKRIFHFRWHFFDFWLYSAQQRCVLRKMSRCPMCSTHCVAFSVDLYWKSFNSCQHLFYVMHVPCNINMKWSVEFVLWSPCWNLILCNYNNL